MRHRSSGFIVIGFTGEMQREKTLKEDIYMIYNVLCIGIEVLLSSSVVSRYQ